MIVINRRQARALLADLTETPGLRDHQFVELHQLKGHGDGPPHRTIELRIPDTEHQELGDYLFPDGTTGY